MQKFGDLTRDAAERTNSVKLKALSDAGLGNRQMARRSDHLSLISTRITAVVEAGKAGKEPSTNLRT